MSGLTKEFLESIDIHIDDETFKHFNDHFSETLYQRVIEKVISVLTTDQMKDFMLLEHNNDSAWQWLNSNVPQLNTIVRDEVNILLSEIIHNSDQINESTS